MPELALGVTQPEAELLNRSWGRVKGHELELGVEVFKVMFKNIPEYQDLFTKFVEPGKTIYESERFQKHVINNIMGSIQKIFDNMENPAAVDKLLFDIGVRHKTRNVNRKHFESFVPILVEAMKNIKGDDLTEDLAEAWKNMASAGMEQLSKGVES